MAVNSENNGTVIAQTDPLFAQHPHFDFQALRREGLVHIGKLSGKIWTDHNAHDPGVTILEELCYALIDLGYRTTLPIEDLLATPQPEATASTCIDRPHHDNFFTPQEILSCNPTTVLDFRKLLLDVDGVRNAWLEPDETSVNGLYNVLIQKEPDTDDTKVCEAVMETLSAHRNLCEDFNTINVLCALKVGVHAEIEIEKTANASGVYAAILKAVQAYIAPELRYYTLQELLDKGKDIEAIFAGRPLLKANHTARSAGFVDTEELEALPLQDALHGSDLYAAILAVDGVIAVHRLAFQTEADAFGCKTIQHVTVARGEVAEFSLPCTCINLQTGQGRLSLDKDNIDRQLSASSKPQRGYASLDLPIPEGRHHPKLAEYYSIQHDFPQVYGISKGGLPSDAPLLRKVQAMQLKGYLLFYDQLLANYLAQIANLRHLFSLRQESTRADAEKHTYFSQSITNVPDWQRLLPKHPVRDLPVGGILAIPVDHNTHLMQRLEDLKTHPLQELRVTTSCHPEPNEIPHFTVNSQPLLDAYIRQLTRESRHNRYSLELHQDRHGYLFMLRFKQVCELHLISYHRYRSQEEAREAANLAVFLASQSKAYATRELPTEAASATGGYQFDLVYDPVAYAAYLQFLVENEDLYLQRREAFLDHLLARFSAQFTDYALLQFERNVAGKNKHHHTIEDKSRFLSQVDVLSRDRGRAYDYLQPSWGTENVSGFEKRVSLLAGMPDFRRRHLCNFEVIDRFRLEMKDPYGNAWFSSIATYCSRHELGEARKTLVKQLRSDSYDRQQFQFTRFDPAALRQVFCEKATDANIAPSRYVYALTLKDSTGNVLRESHKKDYADESLAWQALGEFIEEIDTGDAKALVATGLLETALARRLYIDNRQMQCRIEPIITYKWHCCDVQGKHTASASAQHPSIAAAIQDFADHGAYADIVVPKTDAALWCLRFGNESPPLMSVHAFENELEAQRAWLRCKRDGKNRACYRQDAEPGGQGIRITLATAEGFALATAIITNAANTSPTDYIDACLAQFEKDTTKPDFPLLPTAFGWRLMQQAGDDSGATTELMASMLLFQDMPSLFFGLLDALVAAKQANHYLEAGSEDNPDYRILLKSAGGLFIATTPSYADERERTQHLSSVQNQMMALPPPLVVREEPRRYRWALCRHTDGQVLFKSSLGNVFDSEAAAGQDFEREIRGVFDTQPLSELGQQLYRVDLRQIEDKYRFIYHMRNADGESFPLLHSEDEFNNKGDVNKQYSGFVTALPQMALEIQNETVRVRTQGAPAAVLVNDTHENRANVERLLHYMHTQYDDTQEKTAQPKWIFRLLDRNNPIAKSVALFETEEKAQSASKGICGCNLYPLILPKHVIRVICSPLPPHNKYHYALFLGTPEKDTDNAGVEYPTLISYRGYGTEDAARQAGDDNWLSLIERASDSVNYGPGKVIAVTEAFADHTDSACDKPLAVKPATVDLEVAVKCANCYPLRISYRLGNDGKPTTQAIGFHFQGCDLNTHDRLWRSTIDYCDVGTALDAYQLFLTLLENYDSCRIECEEGGYRVHLVEILAESREFNSKADAWGDNSISPQGVRLFVQKATVEAAFVPVREGDRYRFNVVDGEQVLATHSYNHRNRSSAQRAEERTRACVSDEGMHLVEHILLHTEAESTCRLSSASPDNPCTLEWQHRGMDSDDPCAEDDTQIRSYVPGADPYSFWATLVLPSWTERFRDRERRYFFEQMLHREVPVMVGLNIVWLSPQQMYTFEQALKPWLTQCKDMPDPCCAMVNAIRALRDGVDHDNEPTTAGEAKTETPAPQPDDAAIRKVLSERAEAYKQQVSAIAYAPAKETESYRRANHFLANLPTPEAFTLLSTCIQGEIKNKGSKQRDALITVFSNACWYLLDHLVQEQPTVLNAAAEKALPPLLKAMQKKGLMPQNLAGCWNGKVFGELFGAATAKVVDEYLVLMTRC